MDPNSLETVTQFRSIVDNSTAVIYAKGLAGQYLFVNGEFERLFAVRAADVQGRTDVDIFGPEVARRFQVNDQEVLRTGEPIEREEVVPLADGPHTYLSAKFPLRGEDGTTYAVCGISTDITARKRVEEALRESEARTRMIVDTALDAVVTMDERACVTGWNSQAEATFGWSAEMAIGRTLADLIVPLDLRDAHARGLRRFIQTGEGRIIGRRIELRAAHRDGHQFPVELTLSAARTGAGWSFSAFVRDISARVRADRELRASEQRFRGLIERSWDAIALFDERGLIRYASPSTTRLLGYGLDEFVGRTMSEFIHRDSEAHFAERLAEVLGAPGEGVHVQAQVRHRDGSWRLIEGVLTNLLHEPSIGAIVNNYRDITERLALEAQLLQSQKMEAIGRLAGGIAHDFNNLLTAMIGHVELVQMRLPNGSPLQRDLDAVHAAAQRSAALTRQLLAFARKQVIQLQLIDLSDLAHKLESMLRRLIGEDVTLVVRSAPNLRTVKVDPGQIEQVIVNLAVNARDAMPQGGTLTLETYNADLDDAYAQAHAEVQAGPFVLVTVSDTGAGMPPEVLSHVFEPFFTTKAPGKGTGLGLATSYGIIRQHRGYIWVYSEVGHGTTFKIYLPAILGPATSRITHAAALDEPILGTETVLLAEDEPAVRTIAQSILERCGYVVLVASDGETAMRLAMEYPERIDLLVTDVIMPQMSGSQLAERLRKTRPSLRVLYVSGYTPETIVQHAAIGPGQRFLAKPFNPRDLEREVRSVLDM